MENQHKQANEIIDIRKSQSELRINDRIYQEHAEQSLKEKLQENETLDVKEIRRLLPIWEKEHQEKMDRKCKEYEEERKRIEERDKDRYIAIPCPDCGGSGGIATTDLYRCLQCGSAYIGEECDRCWGEGIILREKEDWIDPTKTSLNKDNK